MKKLVTLLITITFPLVVLSGGLVTNTNQSASFIRMPSLDAIIGIEGVYYNPAGLVHLNNGFHFSFNNQYVTQTRTIESTFPYLKESEYQGDVVAPLFPTFYAVYKMDKLAFSFGVNPIGGGGSAKFDMGLPSLEYMPAFLVPMLSMQLTPVDNAVEGATGNDPGFRNISGYDIDLAFDGTSLNWGFQVGASYAISEMISVSLGARYVTASNTYSGHLKNFVIHAPDAYGGTQTPGEYLRFVASQIEPLDAAGAASLNATAAAIDQQTGDMEVDDEQSGAGVTPIIGLNMRVSEQLNIGLKYEHKVPMTVTHKVGGAPVLYPDGTELSNDMPSLLSAGAGYNPTEKLHVTGGFHYYFDKSADYGMQVDGVFVENDVVIDNNFWEAALGLEYMISEKVAVSAGYLRTQTGVNDNYQSDLTHSLNTNSLGFGGKYMVNENIGVNLGFMYTMYDDYTKEFPLSTDPTMPLPEFKETYGRNAMVVALGFDFKF